MLVGRRGLVIPDDEFTFTYSRSGGPGGQNVNKVNSKATMHWNVQQSPSLPEDVRRRFLARFRSRLRTDGVLVLSSQRYRDQPKNTADCLEKVAAMITEVLTPPKKRRATRPTRGSRERRLKAKKLRSQSKSFRSFRPDGGT